MAICIVVGIVLGQVFPAPVQAIGAHGDRAGQPAGGRADLGDDHPDAAEDRLRRAGPGAGSTSRGIGVTLVHQLGGQAVLDGAAGLDLHPPRCSRRTCRPSSSTATSPA
ncbi:MAG: hypothetical protein MZU91_12680 [Desulfosudis oleivorans]|nr:hypothetical protein [Desulfosudis oleivorans]